MNPENKTGITQSKFLKLLKKNIKRVIAEQGIDAMTRKGDKELDLLVKKIIKQPIQTQEEASQIGERLGTEIVEISRQKGKNNLDKSVIRQLATQGQLPLSHTVSPQETTTTSPISKSVLEAPTSTTQETTTTTPIAKSVSKTLSQETSTTTPVANSIPEAPTPTTQETATTPPIAEAPTPTTQETATTPPVAKSTLKLELTSSLKESQQTTEDMDLSFDRNENMAIEDISESPEELDEEQLLPSSK